MGLVIKVRRDRSGSTRPRGPDWIKILECAHNEAWLMAKHFHERMEKIWDQPRPRRREKRKSAWIDQRLFRLYLGDDVLTKRQMKNVRRRMRMVFNALDKRARYVIVQHQFGARSFRCSRSADRVAYSVAVSKTIKICPRFFEFDRGTRASVIIHEMVHKFGLLDQPFTNHPLDSINPNELIEFAREHPRRARRNPDNYALMYLQEHRESDDCDLG